MSLKREKFVSLANKRVNSAIKSIRLVGNLSSKNNYSYSEQDVKRILAALESELRGVKERFTSKSISHSEFSLEE